MVTEDHHDIPVSEIAAPKKLQRVLFETHPPPPLPSPGYYASECLDKNFNNYSEDKQPLMPPVDRVMLILTAPKTRISLTRYPQHFARKNPSFATL